MKNVLTKVAPRRRKRNTIEALWRRKNHIVKALWRRGAAKEALWTEKKAITKEALQKGKSGHGLIRGALQTRKRALTKGGAPRTRKSTLTTAIVNGLADVREVQMVRITILITEMLNAGHYRETFGFS